MPLKSWFRSVLPTLLLLAMPALSTAQISVGVSVNVPPPELPVYDQPPIPGDGYIWTPGYWAWGDDIQDYYWVPGTWVEAPQPEYLWTPGYWAADGVLFLWHPGYWGPHVGFYGGVDYGYGYGGRGYEGGYWRDGRMYYNRSVNNITTTNVTNVYNQTVINNVNETRVSYNGGDHGVRRQPTASELSAEHERHIPVTAMQNQHVQAARSNPELRASQNNGRPPIAATPRPAAFTGRGVVPASRGGAVSGTTRGTMSVVHANPEPKAPEPRATEPREAQPQNRPASPEYRQAQPQVRPAQPPPPREARPAAPEAPRAPPPEQRRAPEQAPPPRPSAPPPPPPRAQQQPRAEPRPAERAPPREEEHERH
ncbi:MAG TPA: YXWGXW repeat-containing protein [Steroidobacteraceae bacterium]|nr:YXWGXW repeat-containing protein [Steroidobacteraceae bacterium]